jgi:RimJ/RimL family protein N-acetyltransferase
VHDISTRPTALSDLSFVIDAESAPENQPFIGQWSHEKHAAALKDPDVAHFIVEAQGQPVGYVILTGCTNADRSVCFMRLVITEKGKGYGRAALRLACAYAFETLGAHRFWLDVKTFNTRAQALYESEGFVFEGILRECLRSDDGEYQSLAVFSILSCEYPDLLKSLQD